MVEAENLQLSIGRRAILKGIQMHVAAGEIYGLLGPNGAGKSTTISVLTGLRPARSGKVFVLGLDPWREQKALHMRIGVLAEQAGFYDWMTAEDYLKWFARLFDRRLSDADARAHLARVRLEASAGTIGTYSRGMKQRLGLARAVINDPRLLILDEPTNGLDPRGRREIHDVLLGLSRTQRVAILLCTHLLDDVERLCTRIGIIHRGRTAVEGGLDELLGTDLAQGKADRLENLYLHLTADRALA